MSSVESIIELYPYHIYIICDDFHLPDISWSNDSNDLTYSSSYFLRVLYVLTFLYLMDFSKKMSVFNSKGTILDLTFSSTDSVIIDNKFPDSFIPPDFYYPLLNISLTDVCSPLVFDSSHTYYPLTGLLPLRTWY